MAYGTTNKQAAETKANELRAKYPENKYEVESYEWPEAFSPFKKRDGEYERDDNGNRIPVNPERAALLEDWLWSALHPDDAMVFGPEVTDADSRRSSRRSRRRPSSSRSSIRLTSSGLTT